MKKSLRKKNIANITIEEVAVVEEDKEEEEVAEVATDKKVEEEEATNKDKSMKTTKKKRTINTKSKFIQRQRELARRRTYRWMMTISQLFETDSFV